MNSPEYAVITPARNEEAHIGRLIESVASQSLLPKIHVIVSDGSTDQTEAIIHHYLPKLDYLHLITRHHDGKLGFGSKAAAFNMGWQMVRRYNPGFIVNLDADVAPDAHYFTDIFLRFALEPRLGLAG
ncbi:MAG: glycosyltransferase, partial [Methylococcaceae bacterium]